MKILRAANELLPGPRKVCAAIGMFDGVHLGHQEIIRQTISDTRTHDAVSVVVTFDRHPNTVVAPQRVPPLIYSLPQKLRTLEGLGVDAVLLLHFDEALSRLSGEQFIRGLARDWGALESLSAGGNFTFGHRRSGNVDLLRKLGQELHFTVHALPAVLFKEEPISSTRIREAIRQGQLDFAAEMLGRRYALAGPVIAGDRLGRKLGFPTANIDAAGLALPPAGVYAAEARVQGRGYRAVVNLGFRPTIKSAPVFRVEAHLLSFNGELYGQELELALLEKLREEQKFASLDALREQIARDIATAEGVFQRR